MEDDESWRLDEFHKSIRNMGLSEEEFYGSVAPKSHQTIENLTPRGQSFFNNVETMLERQQSIDAFDGVRLKDSNPYMGVGGSFETLLERDEERYLAFIGLRRLERTGDKEGFVAGLDLMFRADAGEISRAEVLKQVAPDLAVNGLQKAREARAQADRDDNFYTKAISLGFLHSEVKNEDGSLTRLGKNVVADLTFMDKAQYQLDKFDGAEPKLRENREGSDALLNMLRVDEPRAIAYIGMRRSEREDYRKDLFAKLSLSDMARNSRVSDMTLAKMSAPDLMADEGKRKKLQKLADLTYKHDGRVLSKGLEKDEAMPMQIDRGVGR